MRNTKGYKAKVLTPKVTREPMMKQSHKRAVVIGLTERRDSDRAVFSDPMKDSRGQDQGSPCGGGI